MTRVEREAEEARYEVEGRLAAASAALDQHAAALSAAAAEVHPLTPPATHSQSASLLASANLGKSPGGGGVFGQGKLCILHVYWSGASTLCCMMTMEVIGWAGAQ